ncbi:hypothetical protein ACQKJ1_01475 [Methylorubrum rhodesianum]|uniref:hypothetical protein n=1 Tax=Methylorubrum rhodesianum TaxID=29427 RepID=UPI003CFF57AA
MTTRRVTGMLWRTVEEIATVEVTFPVYIFDSCVTDGWPFVRSEEHIRIDADGTMLKVFREEQHDSLKWPVGSPNGRGSRVQWTIEREELSEGAFFREVTSIGEHIHDGTPEVFEEALATARAFIGIA